MAEFHIKTSENGKLQGPFSSAQLKKLAGQGKLRPEHLVSANGGASWHPATRVSGLEFPSPASSPQSTPPPMPPQPSEDGPDEQSVVQLSVSKRTLILAGSIFGLLCVGVGIGVFLMAGGSDEPTDAGVTTDSDSTSTQQQSFPDIERLVSELESLLEVAERQKKRVEARTAQLVAAEDETFGAGVFTREEYARASKTRKRHLAITCGLWEDLDSEVGVGRRPASTQLQQLLRDELARRIDVEHPKYGDAELWQIELFYMTGGKEGRAAYHTGRYMLRIIELNRWSHINVPLDKKTQTEKQHHKALRDVIRPKMKRIRDVTPDSVWDDQTETYIPPPDSVLPAALRRRCERLVKSFLNLEYW